MSTHIYMATSPQHCYQWYNNHPQLSNSLISQIYFFWEATKKEDSIFLSKSICLLAPEVPWNQVGLGGTGESSHLVSSHQDPAQHPHQLAWEGQTICICHCALHFHLEISAHSAATQSCPQAQGNPIGHLHHHSPSCLYRSLGTLWDWMMMWMGLLREMVSLKFWFMNKHSRQTNCTCPVLLDLNLLLHLSEHSSM